MKFGGSFFFAVNANKKWRKIPNFTINRPTHNKTQISRGAQIWRAVFAVNVKEKWHIIPIYGNFFLPIIRPEFFAELEFVGSFSR